MGTKRALYNSIGLALCVLGLPATAAPGLQPTPKAKTWTIAGSRALIGEWESETKGNMWRMRVGWDAPSHQYMGYLTRQGAKSADVGFKLKELVWTAKPGKHADVFTAKQKWRTGSGGVSSGYSWKSEQVKYSTGKLTGPTTKLKLVSRGVGGSRMIGVK